MAVAALAALAACSQQSSSENQTEATAATTKPGDREALDANMGTADAGPYAPVMAKMRERMMTAEGANVSETFARMMIPHHEGAIDMSEVLISQGGDERFLAKARKTSAGMRKEIATLESLLGKGLSAGTSGGPDKPFAPAMMKMEQAMMAATGSTLGETWARKMIEHHRGAIDMADIMLRQGGDPKILENARMTKDKQTKEIAELQKMLPV